MIVFISSTFRDLKNERDAVREALRGSTAEAWGMEFFASEPETARDVALRELNNSGAVILVVGFYAGTLVQDDPALTFTQLEFEQAVATRQPIFAFIKTENGSWHNKEEEHAKAEALDRFGEQVKERCTPAYFENTDQLKYEVVRAFAKWNELGRPGARRTFNESHSPSTSIESNPLFDYSQALQGRAAELARLGEFVNDPTKLIAVVTGRGGIGKTKLLREWSARLEQCEPLWIGTSGVWHRETSSEIPAGDVVIIVDDAHRVEFLPKLVALVRDLSAASRRIKLLIGTRPSGTNYVNEIIARELDETQVLRLDALRELSLKETTAIAEEVLGKKYREYAPALAEISKDTPLVTVVGGRLIARGQISPAELGNQDAFRRIVFDRFIGEYEGQLPAGGRPKFDLLFMIAALQPVAPQNQEFAKRAEQFLKLRVDQILQGINSLEQTGLLSRAHNLVRIVPDVLADYLLETACVNEHGEVTGFAEAIFAQFSDTYLSNLLKNLAELDWRIAQRDQTSAVLTKIWGEIRKEFRAAGETGRYHILDAVQHIVGFQPQPVLELVRIAMDGPQAAEEDQRWRLSTQHVLEKLPGLLEWIAFDPIHTSEAISRLWRLTRGEFRRVREAAAKAMKSLAAYKRYKRVDLNQRIAELVQGLLLEKDAFEGEFTPLDIADELLEREGEHTEYQGRTFTISSFGLNYPAAKPVRDQAIAMIETCLNSEDPRTAVRAVKSLGDVLSGFLPRMGRPVLAEELAWQNAERERALDLISKRIAVGDIPLPVSRQIMATLRGLMPTHVDSPIITAARGILDKIPKSPQLQIFDALCTGNWERDIEFEGDITRATEFHDQQAKTAVRSLRALKSDQKEQLQMIEAMMNDALSAGIKPQGVECVIQELCQDETFLSLFSEFAASKDSPLNHFAGVILRTWRRRNQQEFLRWGQIYAVSQDRNLARSAAVGVCFGPNFNEPPTLEDIEILRTFLKSSVPDVLITAFHGVRRIGEFEKSESVAVQLALSVNLPEEPKVADEYCEIFGPAGINPDHLAEGDVGTILEKLVPIAKLDDHNASAFLKWVSAAHPELIFKFVLHRLEYFRSLKVSQESGDYSLVPYRDSWSDFSGLQASSQYKPVLTRVRDLLSEFPDESYWLAKLFWSAAGLDDVTFSVLNEWLERGARTDIERLMYLLREGPERLAVANPEFAIRFVEKSAKLGPDFEKKAISVLVTNSLSFAGAYSVGSLPAPLVAMKDKATALRDSYTEGSIGFRLFGEIVSGVSRWSVTEMMDAELLE